MEPKPKPPAQPDPTIPMAPLNPASVKRLGRFVDQVWLVTLLIGLFILFVAVITLVPEVRGEGWWKILLFGTVVLAAANGLGWLGGTYRRMGSNREWADQLWLMALLFGILVLFVALIALGNEADGWWRALFVGVAVLTANGAFGWLAGTYRRNIEAADLLWLIAALFGVVVVLVAFIALINSKEWWWKALPLGLTVLAVVWALGWFGGVYRRHAQDVSAANAAKEAERAKQEQEQADRRADRLARYHCPHCDTKLSAHWGGWACERCKYFHEVKGMKTGDWDGA